MNKRNLIIFCVILFFDLQNVSAQSWMQTGGSPTIDEAMAVTSDNNNNIYTTGYFTSTLSMDGMQVPSAGLDDIFISKMNATGYPVWLKRAGGSSQERALAIHAEPNGSFVIAGYYYGTTNFGATTLTSNGQQDIFIARYDSSGNVLWAKSAGGPGGDICNAVKFDYAGNIIVAGEFNDSCVFETTTLISQGGSIDAFIAKYDGSGNLIWVKKGSGGFTDRATGIAIDPSNNIYVAGLFSDTISFTNTYPNSMQNTSFLIRLDQSGNDTWFRWIGSANNIISGDIDYSNNGINMTGSFSGSLFFFGVSGNPVLNPTRPNNIFIIRYLTSGALAFSTSNGSTDAVSATAIGSSINGNIFIAGSFGCKFSDYSDYMGTGVFRSVGHLDTYVASYDSTGNWLWARQYGGRQNDYVQAITVYKDSIPVTVGSYKDKFYAPVKTGSAFITHGTSPADYILWSTNTSNAYCSDNSYNNYINLFSKGNSDLFINAAIDKSRQTYDYYQRVGSSAVCNRDELIPCVRHNGVCSDSLFSCDAVVLSFDPGGGTGNVFNELIKPAFSILWGNGANTGTLYTATPGYQKCTITSEDGCFVYSDSLFLATSYQPTPQITDSKGININNPMPVNIELCLGDSVQIWCSNQGASTISWAGYPAGVSQITVNTPGSYQCTLTNSSGCTSVAVASVSYVDSLNNDPINPAIICFEDFDQNDSISVCQYESFHVFLYDLISNPFANGSLCIPELSIAAWTLDNNAMGAFDFSNITPCPLIINEFTALLPGSYQILFSIEVVRANACGTDTTTFSDTLFVQVYPVDNSPINVSISGNNTICPGDTIFLTATPPGATFQWSNGFLGTGIYVTQQGPISVVGSVMNINAFGCEEHHYGFDTVFVAQYPDPFLVTTPVSGVICPNDSVMITSTSSGTIQWFGPTGLLPDNTLSIYSSLPGNYYCFQETGPGCTLLSNTISLSQSTTPALVALPDSACPGMPVLLNIYASAGSGVQWLPPLSGSSLSQSVFTGGVYQCDVSSCGSTITLSASANYYNAPATPMITINLNDLTSTPAVAYQWYLNGVAIPGAVFQTITPGGGGSFTVVTTDANGCTAESLPVILLGIDDYTNQYGFTVFPNPASNEITVTYFDPANNHRKFTLFVRDVNGKTLRKTNYQSGDPFYIGDLNSGFYFIELFDRDVHLKSRFVKVD